MSRETLLGDALRLLRQAQGRRQNEVARAARIKSGQLSNYERANKDPSVRNLRRVLVALKCGWQDLGEAETAILEGRAEEWAEKFRSRRRGEAPGQRPISPETEGGGELDVEALLCLDRQLPAVARSYFTTMLRGYLSFLRYLAEQTLR